MGSKNQAGTLGALLSKAGLVPTQAASPSPSTTPPSTPAAPPPKGADLCTVARLVVRRERKGHGGHTATVVEGLAGTGVDAAEVARKLKRALGCGATLEGGALVVQGDVPDRVAAWLEGQGVKRVVRGN